MNSELYLAFATISLSIFGTYFTYSQLQLAKKKRKDDLFILRFEYYKKMRKIWLSTCNKDKPALYYEFLIAASEEARYLFGQDIADHLISLDGKRPKHDWFVEDDFTKPFEKYLKLD